MQIYGHITVPNCTKQYGNIVIFSAKDTNTYILCDYTMQDSKSKFMLKINSLNILFAMFCLMQ